MAKKNSVGFLIISFFLFNCCEIFAQNYVYAGIVRDSVLNETLSYATITLIDFENKALVVGVSDENGNFKLESSQKADSLKISYINFRPYVKAINQTNPVCDLGTIYLSYDESMLNEVTIRANPVAYSVDKNSYLITNKMRQGTINAVELLDKINGVRFDKIRNTILVKNKASVLLLVNGIKQSEEYIKNLPSERISKVEVVNEPSGRYLSEGYSAIINFILKDDYKGYSIGLRNFSIINPANTNGTDWLANQQNGVSFTYTKNKLNLYTEYIYGISKWHNANITKRYYDNENSIISDDIDERSPNNHYRYNGNYIVTGLTYNIAPTHSLSFMNDYKIENIKTNDTYNVIYSSPESTLQEEISNLNKSKDKDYVGSIVYTGKITDKLSMYSDFSYNYYSSSLKTKYAVDFLTDSENEYRDTKHDIRFNLESDYKFSSKFALNVGYTNVWKRYQTKDPDSNLLLNYTEYRNRGFSYLTYSPVDNISFKVGLGFENIDRRSEENANFFHVLPLVQFVYNHSENINIKTAYSATVNYPTLSQLSPKTYRVDSILYKIGNKNLKPSINHKVYADVTFWDKLTFSPSYIITPDYINENYTKDNNKYYLSYLNTKLYELELRSTYDQPIGEHFSVSSSVAYYSKRTKLNKIKNKLDDWLFDFDLSYYSAPRSLGISMGYHRSIEKNILLYGYNMVNMDSWDITLNKMLFNNKMRVMVSYFCPISLGIRDNQKRIIDSPVYREKSSFNLESYKNMLFIRINFKFNSGKKVKLSNRKSVIESEEKSNRGLLGI